MEKGGERRRARIPVLCRPALDTHHGEHDGEGGQRATSHAQAPAPCLCSDVLRIDPRRTSMKSLTTPALRHVAQASAPRLPRLGVAIASVMLLCVALILRVLPAVACPKCSASRRVPAAFHWTANRTSELAPSDVGSAFLHSCAELAGAGGVYIYKTDELVPHLPTSFSRPTSNSALFPFSNGDWIDPLQQYSVEIMLIRALQESPYITDDPARAKVFIVPQFATHETHSCLYAENPIPHNRLIDCGRNVSDTYLLPLIKAVQASPWYSRKGGQDHFWIFPWDESWTLFPGVPEALQNNHFFGYTGPKKNAVIVPVTARFESAIDDVERNLVFGGSTREVLTAHLRRPGMRVECSELPPHTYLASFAGTVYEFRGYSRGLRQDLLAAFPPATAAASGIAFLDKHLALEEYRLLLRDSLFCLSPQGWTPWSQRLFFAIAVGCIPVFFDMLDDFNIQLPFAPTLNWSTISVTIPMGAHMQVADILRAIPPSTVCRMRRDLAAVSPYLLWSETPQLVVQGVLHMAWGIVKP